jgi:hypothetical protein
MPAERLHTNSPPETSPKLFIASSPMGVPPDSVETNTRMLPNFVPVYFTMPLIPVGGVVGVAVRGTGVGVGGTGVAVGDEMGVAVGDDTGVVVGDET